MTLDELIEKLKRIRTAEGNLTVSILDNYTGWWLKLAEAVVSEDDDKCVLLISEPLQ